MMSIFLEFSRAFDTVSHNIVLKTLYHYGCQGKHLTGLIIISPIVIKQFVQNNDKVSKLANIEHGVPQGSTLGPLLFILYVNYIISIMSQITLLVFCMPMTPLC